MRVDVTISTLVTVIAALAATLAVGWWLSLEPDVRLVEHVPGLDQRRAPAPRPGHLEVQIGSLFEEFDPAPPSPSASWPRFRGPRFDNIQSAATPLVDQLPEQGLPLVWEIELGEGHAAAAVHQGRVYVLDYLETERADMLRCFSFADGHELWRRGYRVHIKRNHGMSRTIPAVTDRWVVSMGPECHVMCVDAATGDFQWGIDLVAAYGAKVPLWYTGQCPFIDGDVAVLAPGGEALMIGVDCETGAILWQTPNPDGWKMSHSSIIPMLLHGRRMYVYCAVGGMVGVAADGPDRGRALWRTPAFNRTVVAPSPVLLPGNRIFITAGYGGGSAVLAIRKTPEGYEAVVEKEIATRGGLASEQQTPILFGDRLFAILPKDAGALRQQFVCVDPNDITTVLWSSGKTSRFGLGPYLMADGKFLILSDDGELTMLQAAPTGYIERGRARILNGPDAWGPMALVEGRLIARDARRMVCVDLRTESPNEEHHE